ncbi:MAG: metal ABC transporter ATP-binding protein [Candidatus Schekmanbacteria bacterium]|nr:metal ABC transporter ATP-binding protein [Candidatus Schekmanbacteria bacterium]
MPIESHPNCIAVENVSFAYNKHSVLEDISFYVKSGEYLGIIGPNGGGKTTLVKILLGLYKPRSGTVTIFGQAIKNSGQRALIGYVPQRVSQNISTFPATVEEIVKSGRTARIGLLKRFSQNDKTAVEKAMETADVARFKTHLIGELSGGEQQRAYIARALAGEPKILVLDEPSVGVDIAAQEKFYTLIENLNKTHGLTIIFVSHDVDVIAHEVRCLLCLNKNLVYHGQPKKFIKDEYLEKLYGKKVKFILHGH